MVVHFYLASVSGKITTYELRSNINRFDCCPSIERNAAVWSTGYLGAEVVPSNQSSVMIPNTTVGQSIFLAIFYEKLSMKLVYEWQTFPNFNWNLFIPNLKKGLPMGILQITHFCNKDTRNLLHFFENYLFEKFFLDST